MAGEATIRCDPLDGEWQTLGAGRFRGVVAEGIEATANPWGPDQLSFSVKSVEPGSLRPDLLPFSPIELEIDGQLVWAGRVRQRPSTDREHNVTCEGWQYHLDDDVFERAYVHTRLADYRDQRSFLGANLTRFRQNGNVVVDGGGIVLGYEATADVAALDRVGVTLDLGPDSTAKRAVMQWESTNNVAGLTALVKGTDTEDGAVTGEDAISFAMNSGLSGTSAGTFSTARRYIHVMLYDPATAYTPIGGNVHLRVVALKLFRATAYESGNASILNADEVVKDALPFAPLLNQADLSQITPGEFNIPEYVTAGYQSPREVMESVNAYENFDLRLGGPDLKTLVYSPKKTVPSVVAGDWSGAQFADSSVAGESIYDQVVVSGTGPDGATLVRERSQTGTLVDRQGFHRTKVLPIRSAGTNAVYDRFGDLWLIDHKRSPFAGKLSASGGLRRWLGGTAVLPHSLLLAAGERVHLAHRVDPDTGAWGRDGLVVGVRYKHDDRSVEVDIDDRRDHFESILQRYGILVDQFIR